MNEIMLFEVGEETFVNLWEAEGIYWNTHLAQVELRTKSGHIYHCSFYDSARDVVLAIGEVMGGKVVVVQ